MLFYLFIYYINESIPTLGPTAQAGGWILILNNYIIPILPSCVNVFLYICLSVCTVFVLRSPFGM